MIDDADKLLTISIAAYNIEEYISKAISSCLSKETRDLIEVLVIVDGATDRTEQIAESFRNGYPDVVRVIKKENGGYGSTINAAIPLARGKYFKQLDGDDSFDLKGLVSFLNDLQNSDADMFLTPFVKVYEKNGDKQLCDDISDIKSGDYSIEDCVDIWKAMRMHCVTFKTAILKGMHIKLTEHCYYTDVEYVFSPLPRIKSVHVSHTPVYCYRIGKGDRSMSIQGIQRHFGNHRIVMGYMANIYAKIENKSAGYAKIMFHMLEKECNWHYRYYCMLKICPKNQRRLKRYDQKLKNNQTIYNDLAVQSKMIAWLRRTRFLLYPLTSIIVRLENE